MATARTTADPSVVAEVVVNPDGSSISGGTGASAGQVQGNVASAATDSGNPVKTGGVYNTTPPTFTNGQRGDTQIGSRGSTNVQLMVPDSSTQMSVASAADAASNPGVASRLETISRNTVYNGTTWDRMRGDTTGVHTVSKPTTAGGVTRHRLLAAATTNATSVKASAGQVYFVNAFNASAGTKYLKFYNKASAPTVGTDTPVETYPLEAGKMTPINFGNLGDPFSTGIAYALTGALADSDTTALAANDVILNLFYA